MNATVFRTITIRGTSEGLDKLQRDLVNLAKGHKDVAIAAEETDKSTRRLEQSWKQQTLRLDEAARAANNIARVVSSRRRFTEAGYSTRVITLDGIRCGKRAILPPVTVLRG